MTDLLIQALIVFWVLLFGAIAVLPLITADSGARRPVATAQPEDRVLSVLPALPAARPEPAPMLPDNRQPDRTAA